jgi:hypothetical protein
VYFFRPTIPRHLLLDSSATRDGLFEKKASTQIQLHNAMDVYRVAAIKAKMHFNFASEIFG